ncbi:hypothetical protein DINM_005710 [Dirofilaria immitis]|nr:hypothetical protein [Dirofilaria immitis]
MGTKRIQMQYMRQEIHLYAKLESSYTSNSWGQKEFKFNECGKIFDRNDDLRRHKKIKHKILPKASTMNCLMLTISDDISASDIMRTDEKEFKCDECGKIFSRNNNLKRHKKTIG